jgi:hypothetical protein
MAGNGPFSAATSTFRQPVTRTGTVELIPDSGASDAGLVVELVM